MIDKQRERLQELKNKYLWKNVIFPKMKEFAKTMSFDYNELLMASIRLKNIMVK